MGGIEYYEVEKSDRDGRESRLTRDCGNIGRFDHSAGRHLPSLHNRRVQRGFLLFLGDVEMDKQSTLLTVGVVHCGNAPIQG